MGADWDDKVPEPLRMKREQWRSDLHLLSEFKVSRCFKAEGFGELKPAPFLPCQKGLLWAVFLPQAHKPMQSDSLFSRNG